MTTPRRHHYMPAFFLSRFALCKQKSRVRVRCIQRDGGVLVTSVTNLGVVKDFHSKDGMLRDPEALLSQRESTYAAAIEGWSPGTLDKKGCAIADEFVAHLWLRSRIIRDLGQRLMDAGAQVTGSAFERTLVRSQQGASIREELASVLALAIEKGGESGGDAGTAADELLRPVLARHLSLWALQEVASLGKAFKDDGVLSRMLGPLHTQAILLQILNRRPRENFGDCPWIVAEVPDTQLVLGDVGPLCVHNGCTRLDGLHGNGAPAEAVLLPLDPTHLLIAGRGRRIRIPAFETINDATIALSRDFVVGVNPAFWFENKLPLFGTRADETDPEQVLGPKASDFDSLSEAISSGLVDWMKSVLERHWPVPNVGNSAPEPTLRE